MSIFISTLDYRVNLPANISKNENVVLLHQNCGPTIDHFIRGPLERIGVNLIELDSSKEPTYGEMEQLLSSSAIIVVRYVTSHWLLSLEAAKSNGSFLIYMMDDDLLDEESLSELPKDYRSRLLGRIPSSPNVITSIFDRIWVTSEFLKNKYASLNADLLPLVPHRKLLEEKPRIQLAYLGTGVHEAEFVWLTALLSMLQERQKHTHVDVFGKIKINKQFRSIPRVRIIHPMKWDRYLEETGKGRMDILLTPLLEGRINAARAPVKFIDAARCGAAGIYSDRKPYRGFIRNGVDGLLVGDDQRDWVVAIEGLIGNPDSRKVLADNARNRALNMSAN